jgi:hypothetical protein
MDSEIDEMELINERYNSTVYIEGESENNNTQGGGDHMYQIRENDEELNNSFENLRKTFKNKPKSLDDFDGEEEG